MPFETIDLSLEGGIATITLNRPERLNTINGPMAAELAQATLEIQLNGSTRVVVIKGAGSVFCGGGDLKDFATHGGKLDAELHTLTTDLHTTISRLVRLPAVVIASVRGSAAGGGMALACACDLVLAAESARFTMAYTRIGLVPDGSSSYFLPRLVGLGRALDLVLTNRMLSADEAQTWGIVTEVVPGGDLERRTSELAAALSAGPRSLGAAKQLLMAGLHDSLESQMARETRMLATVAATGEPQEEIAAFLEKRSPNYTRAQPR